MGNRFNSHNKESQLLIKHPALINAKLIRSEGQTRIRTTTCLDKKEYQLWKEHLQNYEPHQTLFLPTLHTFITKTLCGSAGSAQIVYPNYPHILQQEIYNRLNSSNEFNQQQLWYLLLTLIVAKKQVMKVGEMLGDIRPKNILLNEIGRIKIPTLHSWPKELNKYQKMIENTITYMAPEELSWLESGPIESSALTQPAQMFAIGLTLLSAANLQDYQFLYQPQPLKFDQEKFEEALTELTLCNRYSQVLRSTIANLCAFEAKKRMALLQLWTLLGPHSDKINSKSNFIIYNAPQKLHQQVKLLRKTIAQKTAQYPSSLPDMTNYALQSQGRYSILSKLVPSHLNENTSSAMDVD